MYNTEPHSQSFLTYLQKQEVREAWEQGCMYLHKYEHHYSTGLFVCVLC